MDSSTLYLEHICEKALLDAHKTIKALGSSGLAEIRDSHTTDISTRADRAISNKVISTFRREKIPAILFTEEYGLTKLSDSPAYTISFDDIDGTDNYYRGRGMLPHTSVITLFDSCSPTFENALLAGVLEHNSRGLWLTRRGDGINYNYKAAATTGRTILDRRTSVLIDHYMSAGEVSRFNRLTSLCWVKDFGSAAFCMAGVASGMFDAYLSSSQKFHELGAGFLLAKEAGAFISGLNGNPIDSVPYSFNSKMPIIIAATEELGRKILSEIEPA